MSKYVLQVNSLSKKVGKKKIVDDVSFDIKKGEIFGLLGPNGAGKTTIIRMLVNLISKNEGSIVIAGHDLDRSYRSAINEVGAIIETPQFYTYMSGMKNLQQYARMSSVTVEASRIEQVVNLVGLENVIHQNVKTYSLGMRQRLGIAQAILHNPSILLLDEPTNGLDLEGMKEFRNNLKLLTKEGTSILVSSHLLQEMQLLCDRFAILTNGKIISSSNMDDLNNQDHSLEEWFLELTSKKRKEVTT